MPTWNQRLESYIDELSKTIDSIESAIEKTRTDSMKEAPEVVEKNVRVLEQALLELEHRVAEREDLTRATDAPAVGLTLTENLRASRGLDDPLSKRCNELSQRISSVQLQSISLFVCQFHLAEMTSDLVRILVGDDRPITYQPAPARQSQSGMSSQGGGLLNKSA